MKKWIKKNNYNLVLNWVTPIGLFLLTWFTALFSGAQLEGVAPEFTIFLLKGLPFSFAVLLIVGAHGMGHYIAARKYNVQDRPPYFVPSLFVFGTMGAFTKMQWPIKNRRELLCIFSFGPICGFCVSWVIFIIGLSISKVLLSSIAVPSITLHNSLITYLTELVIIGKIPDAKAIQWHPIAFAGWLGLYYNLWHLFPIGRLDGGRIMYGLLGYRTTRLVSYGTIAGLVALSVLWSRWINLALFGIICMIRFRSQYPDDRYSEPLDTSSKILCWSILAIFILSFLPVPMG